MWLGYEAMCSLPIRSHFVRVPLKVDGTNNPNLRSGSLELFEVFLLCFKAFIKDPCKHMYVGWGKARVVHIQ